MPGTLYVVATPIGNLEDVTLRALRVLREAAVIAAEDTRRTAHLLQHYSISTRTTSLHEHNEYRRVPALVARLEAGESVALVSDAGTPLVSDPGRLLVAAAHAAGIRVEPIPGPSAVMAAISASGLAADEFVFVGFPPARAKARNEWFLRLSSERRTLVIYEAPHRIRATVADAKLVFGIRPIAVGRELTKRHEQLVIRPISEIDPHALPELGEYTLVVGGLDDQDEPAGPDPDPADVDAIVGEITKNRGLSRRDAVREAAMRLGLQPNAVYRLLVQHRKSDE